MKNRIKIIKEEAIADMKACLREHELPDLKVPEIFIPEMKKMSEYVWGTHMMDPYLLEGIINQIENIAKENFFLVGMGGHGFNSLSFSIFINTKPLMYLFQIPFGGMSHDQKQVIQWMNESLDLYQKALAYATCKVKKEKDYEDKKLVMANRHFIGLPCWSWLKMGEKPKIEGWKMTQDLTEALK